MVVLNRIYTRTGDRGETALVDGTRVAKYNPRVEAYGTVDELNATLGLCRLHAAGDLAERLAAIQNDLFDLGGEICIPGHSALTPQHVLFLDEALAEENAALPPLKEFILPGGTRAAALAHVCRTVARRAEREAVTLSHHDAVRPQAIRYLNRLSDLLFVLARVLARADGHGEVLWNHERRR